MRDHLAVSQFPIGYPMKRSNFPMRNLTMSLLTDATVIVEATENSGTLHQAKETLRLGRQLLIMESVLTNPELNWPKEMMKYGAIMLSRGNMDHILAEMPERTDAEPFSL